MVECFAFSTSKLNRTLVESGDRCQKFHKLISSNIIWTKAAKKFTGMTIPHKKAINLTK